jgi:hypothetical protein
MNGKIHAVDPKPDGVPDCGQRVLREAALKEASVVSEV